VKQENYNVKKRVLFYMSLSSKFSNDIRSNFCWILQPIIALFRPTPTSQRRFIFRLVHGAIGHGCHLLAGQCCVITRQW